MSRPCRMPDCRTPVGAASGGRYGLCKQCADRIIGHYSARGMDLLLDYKGQDGREWQKPVALPPGSVQACASLGHWPEDDDDRGEIDMAKRVCANCPSREACLEAALTNREPAGIWGGQTTRERNQTTANRAVAEAWTAIGQTEPGNWLVCKHCGRQFDTPAARGVHESHEHSAAHNEEDTMSELDRRPEVPGYEPAHRWEDGAQHEDERIRQLHARVIEAIRVCEEAMAQWSGQAELLAEEAQLLARLAELRAALRPQAKPLKLAPPSAGGATCDVCGKVCDPRGFGTHMKAHARRGEVA